MQKSILTGFFVITSCVSIIACDSESKDLYEKSTRLSDTTTVSTTIMTDTAFDLSYENTIVPVIVKAGKSPVKGSILLLHGWNLPPMEWCENTDFCSKAIESGYNIIMPDFAKSTYHWEIYPETIRDYLIYPTRKWMYQVFLTTCQNQLNLLTSDNFNVVVGLSTGGRGAALFALEKPDIFDACIALSADFDQTKISDEPINTGFYGPYNKFSERWSGRDNIYNRADEWKVPVYLGHGTEDKICPTEQTILFYEKLKSLGFKDLILSTPKQGHTYDYWGSETDAILEFIDSHMH